MSEISVMTGFIILLAVVYAVIIIHKTEKEYNRT